jgi:hypothetical protein
MTMCGNGDIQMMKWKETKVIRSDSGVGPGWGLAVGEKVQEGEFIIGTSQAFVINVSFIVVSTSL